MTDTIISSLFILAVVVFVIVLPGWWLMRYRRAQLTKEKAERAEQKAKFEERQLRPDFKLFESRFGCPPPQSLRALYENHDLVLDENFFVTAPDGEKYFIAWIEPMNEPEFPDLDGFYCFANDGCGDPFLINPKESDPEVIFLDHELGTREPMGMRLSQFIASKRTK